MARALLSGGKADEEVEGATESSSSDSEPESSVAAVAFTFSGSLRVPCSSPALTNSTGMLRSFLPASKAFLRWPSTKRASSASEYLGFSAAGLSADCTPSAGRRRRAKRRVRAQGRTLFLGPAVVDLARRGAAQRALLRRALGRVLRRAPALVLSLLLPHVAAVVMCRPPGGWRASVEKEHPQLTMMMTLTLSNRVGAREGAGARAQAVR